MQVRTDEDDVNKRRANTSISSTYDDDAGVMMMSTREELTRLIEVLTMMMLG